MGNFDILRILQVKGKLCELDFSFKVWMWNFEFLRILQVKGKLCKFDFCVTYIQVRLG